MDSLPPEVKNYEPVSALNGGDDGLVFYRRLASVSSLLVKPGGYLCVEIGYQMGDAVRKIFSDNPNLSASI